VALLRFTPSFSSAPILLASCSVLVAVAPLGAATVETKRSFDLPRGDAATTLRQFAASAGRSLVFVTDKVRGETTNAVRGEFTPREALERMLAGSALEAEQDAATGALVVSRKRTVEAAPRTGEVGPVSDPQPKPPAKAMKSPRTLLAAFFSLIIGSHSALNAADAPFGSIDGRVENAAAGTYLGNARLTITGGLETFTDAFGYFRFPAVPAGEATVGVFYTGFPAQEKRVRVVAGQVVTQNFSLTVSGENDPDATVKLDAFVVAAGREMSAAGMAVNEQRYTQSIKTVVSSDTFGDTADGNVGEFVKFLPGVSLGYTGGQASSISLGGVPADFTPITIDGNRLASATQAESRTIQLDQISINNMARVEIVRSQNADAPANGIGGTVNLIPKSAFERKNPTYTVKAQSVFLDQAVWARGKPWKIIPSYDATAVVPVSKNFGFTLNATDSSVESAQYISQMFWVPTRLATSANLPTTAFDKPYLGRHLRGNSPKLVVRQSGALSADWRIFADDVVTFGFQYGFFNEQLYGYPRGNIQYEPGRVTSFGPTFTQGAVGAGSLQMNNSTRDVTGTTWQPSLRWRHNGPVWRMEAGGAISRSSYQDRNIDKGYWGPANALWSNLTVRFDDVSYMRPGTITVTDAAGRPVDPTKIKDYLLQTVGSSPVDRSDIVRSFTGSVRRDLALRFPLTVKAGFDFGSQTRDIRNPSVTYGYVGPDGVARTADDSAERWREPKYENIIYGFGFDSRQGFDNSAVYDTFKAHPEYFQLNATQEVNAYRATVNASKRMTEAISAPYLRFDLPQLLDRKLSITGGVRFERTKFNGVGPLINPSFIYQRDAAGNIVRVNGQPVAIAALATLAGTKLAYIERGAKVEHSYGNYFPSMNATCNILPNLIGRISYARSIARPNFNTILPSLNIPDETSANRTITLTNPNLKPWQANSYGAALEYYFDEKTAGVLSVRGYRRDIVDFWGSVTQPVSDELLAVYGLDPSIYGASRGFVVSTRTNTGSARISGAEFDYRQSLTFLPAWAAGIGAFSNLTIQHLQGDTTADFTGFVQRTINWGVSLNRARFTGRVNVNLRGRERRAVFTGVGVEPGTYTYMAPRKSVDASAEYRVTRTFAIYGTVRNLFNAPEDIEQYGPSTPYYARLATRTDYRPVYTVGLKATY